MEAQINSSEAQRTAVTKTQAPEEFLLSDELLTTRAQGEGAADTESAGVSDSLLSRLGRWFAGDPGSQPQLAYPRGSDPVDECYGVCCSGGGIRSASFNLGALQVLQEHERNVLQQATYLSAVSGGSYIASALTTINQTDANGSTAGLLTTDAPAFGAGTPEEQYLRNRVSYMAPGVFGVVRVISQVLLGALVNLAIITAALILLGVTLGSIYGVLEPSLRTGSPTVDTGGVATWILLWAGACVGVAALSALISTRFPKERRVVQRIVAVALAVALIGLMLVVVVPELLARWLQDSDPPTEAGGAIGLGGVAAVISAALLQLRSRAKENRILRQIVDSTQKGATGYVEKTVWPRLKPILVVAAATLAGPLLAGVIVFAATLIPLEHHGESVVWKVPAACALVLSIVWAFGDVTSWSLHPFYKARLSSVFSLRRREVKGRQVAEPRPESPAMRLSELPALSSRRERAWPELVVCAAANVSDAAATPPGRPVTSFVFTPRAVGGPLVGGVPTSYYEESIGTRSRDATLPAAVAVSGAALAPSMGKLTRAPFRFLLTLANVRLGVWLPNPRRIEECRKDQRGKRISNPRWRPGLMSLVREFTGTNSLRSRLLYVSDGGHYENLGLVELLRRGCRDVYCFDASGGRDTQELGDAIALCRSELQIEIRIDTGDVEPDEETGLAKAPCKVGKITFPDKTTGRLVYVRSVLTADAPHDVRTYHEADPEFPHNSTGQQLYTDQRFEAYRALGRHAARRALQAYVPPHLQAPEAQAD